MQKVAPNTSSSQGLSYWTCPRATHAVRQSICRAHLPAHRPPSTPRLRGISHVPDRGDRLFLPPSKEAWPGDASVCARGIRPSGSPACASHPHVDMAGSASVHRHRGLLCVSVRVPARRSYSSGHDIQYGPPLSTRCHTSPASFCLLLQFAYFEKKASSGASLSAQGLSHSRLRSSSTWVSERRSRAMLW
jgi:hypothetical protein